MRTDTKTTEATKTFIYQGTGDALVKQVRASTNMDEDTEITFILSNPSESEIAIQLLEDKNLNLSSINSSSGQITLKTHVYSLELLTAINALLLPDFAAEICKSYPTYYYGPRDLSKRVADSNQIAIKEFVSDMKYAKGAEFQEIFHSHRSAISESEMSSEHKKIKKMFSCMTNRTEIFQPDGWTAISQPNGYVVFEAGYHQPLFHFSPPLSKANSTIPANATSQSNNIDLGILFRV